MNDSPQSTLRKAQEAVAAIAAEVRLFDGVSPRKHQIREWADQLDEIHRALAAQAGDGCVIAGSEQPSAVHALQESAMFRATQPREQAGAGAVALTLADCIFPKPPSPIGGIFDGMAQYSRQQVIAYAAACVEANLHHFAAPCPRAEGVDGE
jgi:hypothetical protein